MHWTEIGGPNDTPARRQHDRRDELERRHYHTEGAGRFEARPADDGIYPLSADERRELDDLRSTDQEYGRRPGY